MRDLRRHMTDTCYYAVVGSTDITGNPTYGTPTAFKGRVVRRHRRVVNQAGEEVLSSAQIQTFTPITTAHWLWLPGADQSNLSEGQQPLAVNSEKALGSNIVIYEVML